MKKIIEIEGWDANGSFIIDKYNIEYDSENVSIEEYREVFEKLTNFKIIAHESIEIKKV